MVNSTEALKLALDALKDLLDQTESPPDKNCICHIAPPCSDCVDYSGVRYAIEQANKTITAIKEALAQEQEPVAVVDVHEFYDNCANFSLLQKLPKGKHTLYTHPPQRTWVGLTDEEIDSYFEDHGWSPSKDYYPVIKAIEAKLKQKNGYAEENT